MTKKVPALITPILKWEVRIFRKQNISQTTNEVMWWNNWQKGCSWKIMDFSKFLLRQFWRLSIENILPNMLLFPFWVKVIYRHISSLKYLSNLEKNKSIFLCKHSHLNTLHITDNFLMANCHTIFKSVVPWKYYSFVQNKSNKV